MAEKKADKAPVRFDWSGLDRAQMEEYLNFLMHNYRVMDAFWFLNIEQRHGHAEACKINELVWGKVSGLATRDLKARFDFGSGGLDSFVKALKLFPWYILVGYDIEQAEDEVIIRVPSCPAQQARLDHGLGEYDCQDMHRAEFEAFTGEIDPDIETICDFAPPGEHPPDLFCQWRFRMKKADL